MRHTVARPGMHELVVRKSRFLGCVEPVADRAQAQARVAELRALHPTANHVCWALPAGGDSAAVDDGEPGGTAGRPMLNVLRQQQLDGVLATVVRWFGGVKLGAGGLVRAYTEAVAGALQQTEKIPLQRWQPLACTLPYALEGVLRRELERAGARALAASHAAQVRLRFELPEDQAAAVVERLDEISQGQLLWHET
ncbi:MAG TPA: YigZ family protein [Ottowia sp.]|uniref:IMPACT family protein n=1 Tax=Ottowia sp. TaxID=1898956 RepID=UPI002CB35CE5|nr:YigZ family protein [Ottowia sp.]HMN21493.1 YigZ family protein [Ottowia sp.]